MMLIWLGILYFQLPASRKSCPSDISDEEWQFVAPYLTLMIENAPQRSYILREVFNALRWLARAGAPWRLLHTTFRPGRRCTSSFVAGTKRADSRRW
jgi:transposase